jgi:hypothetical protein
LALGLAAAAGFAASQPGRVPILAFLTSQDRPAARMPTITSLPRFPGIPLYAQQLSQERKDELVQLLINHKISTWPEESSRGFRPGKFTSTGIFGGFPPTEEQIARIAPHYDNILLGAHRRDLIPRFERYNPDLTFFIYVDSGLNPGFVQADAGSVDEEDTEWIVENHPDWILKDAEGNFVRSVGGLANPGAYWPDPGNREWQDYFAEKVTKLLQDTGGEWDGIVFDQFLGTADGHESYAGSARQANYPTDEAYQAAYLEFLERVASKLPVPLIVNMEGVSIIRRPDFVAEVALAAGGAENEIFPDEMPDETLRPYLETVQSLPPGVHIRINSKPGGYAGDIDDTLFAYYCYLLIAGRDREVYWTYKEGTSDIPHYWFHEFDLNLGDPLGDIDFSGAVWSREFENAVVIVNAFEERGEYTWDGADYYGVEGNQLESPLVLDGRTAMLLVKDPAILPP